MFKLLSVQSQNSANNTGTFLNLTFVNLKTSTAIHNHISIDIFICLIHGNLLKHISTRCIFFYKEQSRNYFNIALLFDFEITLIYIDVEQMPSYKANNIEIEFTRGTRYRPTTNKCTTR